MSPRRRTLCFVLTILSLSNGLVFVAGIPLGPVSTEYYPSPASPPQLANSFLTVPSVNRVFPEFPQKVFPTQRFNEAFSFGSSPQSLSINTVATSNYGIAKPIPFTTYPTSLPSAEISNTLTIGDPITEAFSYPSEIDSLTIIENYPPVTQTIQVEGYAPTANVVETYQTPITVQVPSMPQLSPLVSVASPIPEILPTQNIIQDIYTPNILPVSYPQTIETEIATITSVPVETTTLNNPSYDLGCGGQQLPVTLQINMASPWIPEPMTAVISQPAPIPVTTTVPTPCSPFDYPSPPVPPIIVIEKSKSKWKSILPILMLTLFDGGCGNNGGSGCPCSQCIASTPIPFPIVIPTSNPIVTRSRGEGKSKGTVKPVPAQGKETDDC